MALDNIKKIAIKEYLGQLSIFPIRENGLRGIYHSPLREDRNASFCVDYNRNVWFDHGLGKGGSIIDLVSLMENISIADAIRKLENSSFSFHRSNDVLTPQIKQDPAIRILSITGLNNPALFQYLKERSINIELAKAYCKEIHYAVNDKAYFAIGFANDSGDYELRSKYFKGCTSKDCTTTNNKDNGSCLVFEGFMDYLSYLTMTDIKSVSQGVIVLNSVANLPKTMDFIKSHQKIYTYLDNDEAGKKATLSIQQSHPNVVDQSVKYANYKDLNEYLISAKQAQEKKLRQEVKRKPSRGFRR